MKTIKRKYLKDIISVMGTPDIKVITGVRRSGKSELLHMFTDYIKETDNNANIIAFGARIVGSEMAKAIVDAWLDAKYIGSGRHERRVNMIEEEAAKYNK